MDTQDRPLGARLREIREEAGLTQDQLAAKLGISRVQVSRVESGARSTGIETVRRWHRACGYELDGVSIGTPEQAESLALAVAELPEAQLDDVISIIKAWPVLSDLKRGKILGLIESDKG